LGPNEDCGGVVIDFLRRDEFRWHPLIKIVLYKKRNLNFIFGNCDVTDIFLVAKVKTLSKLQKSVFKKAYLLYLFFWYLAITSKTSFFTILTFSSAVFAAFSEGIDFNQPNFELDTKKSLLI
jgi:hypothetical protein